jgi:hypothetical protein
VPNRSRTHASEKTSAVVRKSQPAARASRRLPEQVHPAVALARAMSAPTEMISPTDILTLQRSDLDVQFVKKSKKGIKMEGNHYPVIDELLESIGLRFNWQKEKPEPVPEKIGKALPE